VLFPCLFPKPLPLIVTEAPTAPEAGDKLLIPGGPLLAGASCAKSDEVVATRRNTRKAKVARRALTMQFSLQQARSRS